MKNFLQLSRQASVILKTSWRGKKVCLILIVSLILTAIDFLLREKENESRLRILHFADITEIDEGGVFPGS